RCKRINRCRRRRRIARTGRGFGLARQWDHIAVARLRCRASRSLGFLRAGIRVEWRTFRTRTLAKDRAQFQEYHDGQNQKDDIVDVKDIAHIAPGHGVVGWSRRAAAAATRHYGLPPNVRFLETASRLL